MLGVYGQDGAYLAQLLLKKAIVWSIRRVGWQAKIGLEEGLGDDYWWFLQHQDDFRN